MIPRSNPDRETLVAVEGGVAVNEFPLPRKIDRAGAQGGLHDHLHREPGRPVGALHVAAAGALLEARIDLRGAVVLPGPMPSDRLKIDAADDRARAHRAIGYLAHEIEGFVGHEHDVVVAVDGADERRVVLLALARVGAGLEILVRHDAGAELL